MFTEGHRHRVRARLIERARLDDRITGAAITGSAARDAEDRWSDIDLFFGVATRALLGELRESDPRRATDLDKPLLDLAAVS
jgi:predicted nucleotidyltransferase